MRNVYIVGVGMTRFGKYQDRNMKSLATEAVDAALKHADLERKDIQVAAVGNAYQGLVTGQESIRGQVALRSMGIGDIPVINVENACASGSTAAHVVWMDIALGLHDVGLALGMEKMFMEDKEKRLALFSSSMDVEIMEQIMKAIKGMSKPKNEEKKEGDGGKGSKPKKRSAFMDVYAAAARMWMDQFGLTQRQLAMVASKNQTNGSLNPYAQYQKAMTVEEVLEAPEIAYPLTRPMCSPIGDGSAAAILCSEDFLKRVGPPKPVKVLAVTLGSGMDRGMKDPDLGVRLSKRVYETAGLGPEDVNVAEVHDATAFGEIRACEDMGFCEEGEGGKFIEEGHSQLNGKLPVNPSGGLEAKGHPVGATGVAQIAEIVWQLRGEADKRQVDNPRIGLCENGGGNIGIEEASMVITVLERV